METRRGAEPEKHHSGLHFITMATSWKPYRIRAPEHQIREEAVGRMPAPHGQMGSPGAWGWGAGTFVAHCPLVLGQTTLSCLLPSFHSLHPTASSPIVLEKGSNSLCKANLRVGTAAGWMLCCVRRLGATCKGRSSIFPLPPKSC